CNNCSPAVTLDSSAPRILEHIGAHILFDSKVKRSDEPCGLCQLPAQLCRIIVVPGKGTKASPHVDWNRSTGCARPVNFSYRWASEYNDSSPCTNVPLICKLCPKDAPAVWRYNLSFHLGHVHSQEAVAQYADLCNLSDKEMAGMKDVWRNRLKAKATKRSQKNAPLLTISEAHCSTTPIHSYVPSSAGLPIIALTSWLR
ncbi:hypothetical protein FA13DRAFT_1642110, partial [Coprinellus micaceus]